MNWKKLLDIGGVMLMRDGEFGVWDGIKFARRSVLEELGSRISIILSWLCLLSNDGGVLFA